MGNEAIALGALAAGVDLVAGYPGTPSTEVLETVAKRNPGDVHVEWSINEKAAMEVAAGAAYCGARALATMKQVYEQEFGSTPRIVTIHAGLECGIIGANYPNMEMISFGPTIEHPHSPDERVNIATVQKFYRYVTAALQQLS